MKLQLKNYFFVAACCFATFFVNAQMPNVPGDFADPSVIKVGDTYYTTATSSNWMPVYPILKSKDLKNWEWVTNVFPEKPSWAEYYFWAPELSYENGKVYLYYNARRRGGALAIAVASADRPEGPYRDHGPLVEQPMGSIDAFPMRDENGKLFLIWKEDGNSQRKPTIMWIQEMNEERTKLLGERKEMFRDTEKWERNLVEAAAILKHNNYFFTIIQPLRVVVQDAHMLRVLQDLNHCMDPGKNMIKTHCLQKKVIGSVRDMERLLKKATNIIFCITVIIKQEVCTQEDKDY